MRALRRSLPRTTVTVDPFHAVKLANACVDDVRRRVQRETLGHRGRKDDPLYGIRRLLTRGYERLNGRQEARLLEGLRRGDPFDEVGGVLAVKEQLRAVSAARSLTAARRELATFYSPGKDAGPPARTPAPPRWSGCPGPSSAGSPKCSRSSSPDAQTHGARPRTSSPRSSAGSPTESGTPRTTGSASCFTQVSNGTLGQLLESEAVTHALSRSRLTAAPGKIGTVGMTPIYQSFGTKEEKRAWRRARRRKASLLLS
jgi:hypothetical protein